MKWQDAKLYEKVENETDRLGNPIVDFAYVKNIKVRKNPWTKEEVNAGRDLEKTSIRLITPTRLSDLIFAAKIEIDGVTYKIKELGEMDRWRSLVVTRYEN